MSKIERDRHNYFNIDIKKNNVIIYDNRLLPVK